MIPALTGLNPASSTDDSRDDTHGGSNDHTQGRMRKETPQRSAPRIPSQKARVNRVRVRPGRYAKRSISMPSTAERAIAPSHHNDCALNADVPIGF